MFRPIFSFTIALACWLCLAALCRAQDDDAAAAALAIARAKAQQTPQAPAVRPEPVPAPKGAWLTYTAGAAQAVATAQPLVVFIGTTPRAVVGAVVARSDGIEGYDAPAVIISAPGDGWLVWRATLPATASDAEIRAALARREAVQPQARFFQEAVVRDADGELPAAVAAFVPEHFQRYRAARFTQRIATTNNAPSIDPVPRSQLERKYQVPGGLENVAGVRSDLFKWATRQRWQARLPVLNSFGFIQHEWGWTARYEVGSVFMDVLSYDGKVFAVREAEKEPDGWHRFTSYRDRAAEPPGYVHIRGHQCAECHAGKDRPGTGGYAVAMLSGADQVFSDPIPELEGR